MKRRSAIVGVLWLTSIVLGCGGSGASDAGPPVEVAGQYRGVLRDTSLTRRLTSDMDGEGRSTQHLDERSRREDAVVTVALRADGDIEVDIGARCRVRFRETLRSAEPPRIAARVVDEARCPLRMEDYDGEVEVSGTLTVEERSGSRHVDLAIAGAVSTGDPDRAGALVARLELAFTSEP